MSCKFCRRQIDPATALGAGDRGFMCPVKDWVSCSDLQVKRWNASTNKNVRKAA